MQTRGDYSSTAVAENAQRLCFAPGLPENMQRPTRLRCLSPLVHYDKPSTIVLRCTYRQAERPLAACAREAGAAGSSTMVMFGGERLLGVYLEFLFIFVTAADHYVNSSPALALSVLPPKR